MNQLLRLAIPVTFALLAQQASAQQAQGQTPASSQLWKAMAAEIPMRDGLRLHTIVIAPVQQASPMPIMLERTPYGSPDDLLNSVPADAAATFARNGYIRVFQDIRGRHGSEGSFVMLRPPHPAGDPYGVDECTDTYDTIDWLIKNVPGNNGRVGMKGGSYDGWLAAMAVIHPHPALKAVCPQAPVADMFIGDDFHHNGAFRLSYAFEYVWMLESGKEENTQWPIDLPNAYDWYLRLGPLANANANYLHGTRPSWNDFVAHPNYDSFWKRQAITDYLNKSLTVPTLVVGGWYDQEDFYGPQRIYDQLSHHDPFGLAYLVLGPWNHGGWEGEGRDLGPISFGSATGKYYKEEIEKPWFDHWLKDSKAPTLPHVWTFETGGNKWVTRAAWPPARNAGSLDVYLGASHSAFFAAPITAASNAYDIYVSDPSHPAPYRTGPILPTYADGSTWETWLTDDQRALESRSDVLTWKTAPLTKNVAIAGAVLADLFASTSGSDSDWVVKLLDVYPDDHAGPAPAGYELIISDEVFRARFRKSFERPEAVPSNRVEEYRIDLHSADHVFLKGHRIGVQIQSAWFPLIDRNPQRFVPNIFEAKAGDFQPATQRIYRSPRYPTRIEMQGAQPTEG